jgi:hypothetical protein
MALAVEETLKEKESEAQRELCYLFQQVRDKDSYSL